MASAVSKFTWDDHKVDVRAYVGLGEATDEDTNLELWLAAAATDLDYLAGWIYTDANDEAVDVSPDDPSANASWRLGVYEWVKAFRAVFDSPVADGLASVKTGALSEVYQGGVAGLQAQINARRSALPFWFTAIANISRSPKAS